MRFKSTNNVTIHATMYTSIKRSLTHKMQTMTRDYSFEQLQTIKGFFTDDEWDAIDSALGDYQDYGDNEARLMSTIRTKLSELFKND